MKKAIVEYNGQDPVGLREVKDFRTEASYDAFSALCAKNKAKADAEALREANEKALAENEIKARENAKWAHVALLFTEMAIDHGELVLTEDEYASFKDNFNNGYVKDLSAMPEIFVQIYEKVRVL